MFIRSELKTKAKQSIHQNIWMCIGICIVVSILTSSLFGVSIDINTQDTYFRVGLGSYGAVNLDFITIPVITAAASLISLLSLAYSIFVSNPLKVGQARYFIENREEPSQFETLFAMFKSGVYFNVVKIMLLRDVKTALWMLLLIFPGIYKSYEYYMIPYILAENPEMDSSDVFELTKILTRNIKFDIFILNLSFFGWVLLSMISCGIAALYTLPYIAATDVELYVFLRDRAIEEGDIAPLSEEVEYVEPGNEDLY